MKTKIFYFVILAFMLFTVPAAASVLEETTSVTAMSFVAALNSVIVYFATKGAKGIIKVAPKWVLGAIVPVLSAVSAWLLNKVVDDSSFLVTFLLGLVSTFIDQFITKFSEE